MNVSHRTLFLLASATVLAVLHPAAAAAQDGRTITTRKNPIQNSQYTGSMPDR